MRGPGLRPRREATDRAQCLFGRCRDDHASASLPVVARCVDRHLHRSIVVRCACFRSRCVNAGSSHLLGGWLGGLPMGFVCGCSKGHPCEDYRDRQYPCIFTSRFDVPRADHVSLLTMAYTKEDYSSSDKVIRHSKKICVASTNIRGSVNQPPDKVHHLSI